MAKAQRRMTEVFGLAMLCMEVMMMMEVVARRPEGDQGRRLQGGKWPGEKELEGGMVLRYYLQQQYGENEFTMVQAARTAPAGAGFTAGVGLEVVYEFVMTSGAEAWSEVMGFVRGTALVVNSTAAATVFLVNNVIHWEFGGLNGTLSQQGEAVFSLPPWEFSILSGTGCFRLARGFNVGTFVSSTPSPNGTHIVTYYEAHLFLP